MVNPLVINEVMPRFSWLISASYRNVRQSSYHVLVADTPEKLAQDIGNYWDSKVINADQSINVIYAGKPLRSGQKYFWKVKISDRVGQESGWSGTAWFQMGLLSAGDWGAARWIAFENLPDSLKIFPGIPGYGKKPDHGGIQNSIVPLFR